MDVGTNWRASGMMLAPSWHFCYCLCPLNESAMPDTVKLVTILPTPVKGNREKTMEERAQVSKSGLANACQGLARMGGSPYLPASCGFAPLES